MSEKLTKQIRREIRAFIESDVVAGFDTPAEIVESVVGVFCDEVPVETLRPLAEKLVARAVERQGDEQADWPEVTDNDRLDAAFKELEEQYGIWPGRITATVSHAGMRNFKRKSHMLANRAARFAVTRSSTAGHGLRVETGILHLAFGTLTTDEEIARESCRRCWRTRKPRFRQIASNPSISNKRPWTSGGRCFLIFPCHPPSQRHWASSTRGQIRAMLERLGWMTMSPKNELAVFKVVNDVLDVLQRHGLDATWEGLSEQRIEVKMDWKRRR